MLEDVVIRIGIVGNFYEDNFNLILRICMYKIFYKNI